MGIHAVAHRESPHPTFQSPGIGARTPPSILIFHGNTFILDGAAIPAIPTTDLYTSLGSQNYLGDILDGTAIPAIQTTDQYTCLRSQNYFGDMLQWTDHYSYTTMSPTFQMRESDPAGTL
jgi:hypothetical protein